MRDFQDKPRPRNQPSKKLKDGEAAMGYLYLYWHTEQRKKYLGWYIDLPVNRDYLASTKNEEFWDSFLNGEKVYNERGVLVRAGKLKRRLLAFDAAKEIQKLESKLLAKLYEDGKTKLYYNFQFNFPDSFSTLGKEHSAETKAKMSAAKKGEKSHMFGRTGENHPMFGRTGEDSSSGKAYDIYFITGVWVEDIYYIAGEWVGLVKDPVAYAKKHNLSPFILSQCANPKNSSKWFKIGDIKFTARYNEGSSPERIQIKVRWFVIKDLSGTVVAEVIDAGEYERQHGLSQGSLARCADPKTTNKYIKLNGKKHTVERATKVSQSST